MHGIVFLGGRRLELREFDDPRPGPGEVVVRMKASGMCNAAIFKPTPFFEATEDDLVDVVSVNVRGTFSVTQALPNGWYGRATVGPL